MTQPANKQTLKDGLSGRLPAVTQRHRAWMKIGPFLGSGDYGKCHRRYAFSPFHDTKRFNLRYSLLKIG